MRRKAIQAKHVPEASILRVLAGASQWMTHWDGDRPAWNLPAAAPELRAVPEKVLRAKLGAMARRGLIDGCDCGCRGDWRITEAGREALTAAEARAAALHLLRQRRECR